MLKILGLLAVICATTYSVFAQPVHKSNDPGCDLFFNSSGDTEGAFCATIGTSVDASGKPGITLSFWNHIQGITQIPVYYSPGATKIVSEWKNVKDNSNPLPFTVISQPQPNAEDATEVTDGVYTVSGLSFLNAVKDAKWQLTVSLEDEKGVVYDKATSSYPAASAQ